MTKYRVGDEVTVRGVVKATECNTRIPLLVNIGCSELWLLESEIASHTPKPREFKLGDMVRVGNRLQILEVVAIKEKYVILWDKKTARSSTFSKEYLSHADEAE